MKELLTMLHSAQMNLDTIKLSEINAVTKRQPAPDSSYRNFLEQPDSPQNGDYHRWQGGRVRSYYLMSVKFLFCKMKRVL